MSQVPIPDDWDGDAWCTVPVEWPASQQWQAILLGLVTWPLRGRFWDGRTGIITDAQAVGKDIFTRNILGGVMMSGCIEEMVSSIECLCEAIYNTTNNGGSNGAGVIDQSPSGFVDDGANWPDGYVDRDEYIDGKCRLSQRIVDNWLSDLAAIRTLNVAQYGAAALAGVLALLLLTPISLPVLVLSMASALLGLTALGINALVDAIDELSDRLGAMDICLLYGATSASEALDNVEAYITNGTYTHQTLTAQAGLAFITYDAINVMFDAKDDNINYDALPPADCSSCVIGKIEIMSGALVSGNLSLTPGVVEISSVLYSSPANCPENHERVNLVFGSDYTVIVDTDQTTSETCLSDPAYTFRVAENCVSVDQRIADQSFQGLNYCVAGGHSLTIRAEPGDPFTLTLTKVG